MFGGAGRARALGALAGEVVGVHRRRPAARAARGRRSCCRRNVGEFGAGLGVPDDEVRLYLALREAAHQRLFAHVPWLRSRLHRPRSRTTRAASGSTPAGSRRSMRGIDPSNPEAIQEALAVGHVRSRRTPRSRRPRWPGSRRCWRSSRAGWTPSSTEAVDDRLPAAAALRETMRRRRAAGGPAEQTFATLVGLELRPRRLREAAALWAELRAARGIEGRDALWAHPDLLPDRRRPGRPRGVRRGASGSSTCPRWTTAPTTRERGDDDGDPTAAPTAPPRSAGTDQA